MGKKTKIGYFFPYGKSMTGAPRFIMNMMNLIDRDKYTPIVFTQQDSPLIDKLKEANVEYEIIQLYASLNEKDGATLKAGPVKKLFNMIKLFFYNLKVRKAIKKHKVEAMWIRNVKGVMLAGFGAKWAGVPIVWDIGMESESKGLVRKLHTVGLNMVSRVVIEAHCLIPFIFGEERAEKYKDKFKVIYPAVTHDRIAELEEGAQGRVPNEAPVIVTVGAVSERKNQILLLQSAKILKDKGLKFVIRIVGGPTEGPYWERLQSYAEQNSLGDSIDFFGWSDEVPKVLGTVDAFALVSTNEGLPFAGHEALHSGLPVVMSRVGGMPECMIDQETGFLVDLNAQDLADKLEAIITNVDQRLQMGVNSKQLAQDRFIPEKWIGNYQNTFEQVLGR